MNGTRAHFLDAAGITPEWTTEQQLSDHIRIPSTPNRVLALWGEELFVVCGSPGEIRRLLLSALSLVPEEQ